MLVLTRRVGEAIQIGNQTTVRVLDVNGMLRSRGRGRAEAYPGAPGRNLQKAYRNRA